jgi:tripartite-type tricarboxylate transporter receptor subunit TctC
MFKYFLYFIVFISCSVQAETTALIIPTGPGGLYHKYAAEFEPVLSTILKKNVIIEFHPGAQGLIGAQILADNKKSDISLMISAVQPEFAIDQQRDIIPILYLGVAPVMLISNNKLEIHNIQDLVNVPRKLNVGVVNGSSQLFWIRKLAQQNPNLTINEIPYKSGSGMIVDVANGNLDLALANAVGAIPLIQDNKIRALAVLSTHRSTALPSVPTTFEQGARFDTGFAHLFIWSSPGITPDKIVEIQKQFKQWTQTNEAQNTIEKMDLGFDLENSIRPAVVMNKILKNDKTTAR